jgi:hypothetical protein
LPKNTVCYNRTRGQKAGSKPSPNDTETTMRRRKSAPRAAIRARLQSSPNNGLDIVIEPGLGRFPANEVDVVLRQLLKVREVVG